MEDWNLFMSPSERARERERKRNGIFYGRPIEPFFSQEPFLRFNAPNLDGQRQRTPVHMTDRPPSLSYAVLGTPAQRDFPGVTAGVFPVSSQPHREPPPEPSTAPGNATKEEPEPESQTWQQGWQLIGSLAENILPRLLEYHKKTRSESEAAEMRQRIHEMEMKVEEEKRRHFIEANQRDESERLERQKQIQEQAESDRRQIQELIERLDRKQQEDNEALRQEREKSKILEQRAQDLEREKTEREQQEKQKQKEVEENSLQGKYEEIRELGKGAFAKVFLVKSKCDGKYYAAKVLSIEEDEEKNREVRREMAALRKLENHRNIVQLTDVYLEDKKLNKTILVLEYCPDGTLNDVILQNHPSVDVKKIYMREILAALVHIHKANILHLDLKPDNILLRGNTIKVSDFGIAKTFSHSRYEAASLYYYSSCGVLSMPRFYRPPEVVKAESTEGAGGIKKVTTFKVDIYQAGCTFLAMLLETKVKWNENKELLAAYLSTRRGLPKELSEAMLDDLDVDKLYSRVPDESLRNVVKLMTHEDPKQRPNASDIEI